MQNNYRMGRLITLIFYFLEGLMTVLVNVLQKKEQLSVTLTILGVWLVSFWLLSRINDESMKSKRIYYIAESFFSGMLACALAYATENMYFMLFVFWGQWMAYTLFLDKLASRIALGIHIFFVYVLSFADKAGFYFRVRWNEAFVEAAALVCIWWLTEIIINYINSQNRLNREQEMSLDDMLKLVEAMCDEAQLATKSKSIFLSYISHEIRTPINAVLGMNEMILRECEDKQILSYAANIKSSGKTLLFLINDLLDMTKIESGKMDIVPAEYDVTDVMMDLWNIIYLRAQDKGLTVDFVLDKTMPRKLFGDDVRIKQIVTNLLTNAVKYTPQGGVELRATYKKTGEDKMDLIISVQDTGIGIRQEDMGRLFEDFQRLDEKRNRNIEGTGLGMNITRSLLDLMNGDIEVESEYQKGSTFTVTIPQKILDSETTGDFEQVLNRHMSGEEQRQEGFEAPEAKVLVVDDNNVNLSIFESLLKRTKMNIVKANSGKNCLELVKRHPFHLIFIDHLMPEMDGIETLHEIRKLTDFPNEKTPVIALTANAISGAKESYLKEGFADFLTKPIDADTLERLVVSYLPKELVQVQNK
ncbi:MAG: response regulator [Lachnospiraceae bacterium]|nr:response regulator [Lachnospiraceae bacterium]